MSRPDPGLPLARDPRLGIIERALRELLPDVPPMAQRVAVFEDVANPDEDEAVHMWRGTVEGAAEHIHTRLYGAGQPAAATPPASPLQQAQQAKQRRDIGGEIGALMSGDQALREAPWYPAQAGDLLIVHHEASDRTVATGDSYVVVKDDIGDLVLEHLRYSGPEGTTGGWYAPGMADEPFYEAWFEAGPASLVIVRDGRVVHDGPSAAAAAAAAGA